MFKINDEVTIHFKSGVKRYGVIASKVYPDPNDDTPQAKDVWDVRYTIGRAICEEEFYTEELTAGWGVAHG